jgi:hypothetical protein
MTITRSLAKTLTNYDSKNSVGSRLRSKRIAPLLEMIRTVYDEKGSVDIVDIGGSKNYWRIIPQEYFNKYQVNITIVNLPADISEENHGPFRFVVGDGCNLVDFDDQAFDIAHSNSVIEHVGDWERMVKFAKELSRVAPRRFVQTPNYWFPIEPHFMTPFIHWLPKPLRIWLVQRFQLGHLPKAATIDEAVRLVESFRLLNKKMLQELFKDSEILTERLCWLPKSHIAVRSVANVCSPQCRFSEAGGLAVPLKSDPP